MTLIRHPLPITSDHTPHTQLLTNDTFNLNIPYKHKMADAKIHQLTPGGDAVHVVVVFEPQSGKMAEVSSPTRP